MSKALSGILGSTVASGVVYLLMGLIALDTPNIVASLTVGSSIGFLVGSALTIFDRNRSQSMLHSTVSGGAISLTLVAMLVGAIMYADSVPTSQLTPTAIIELVSMGLIGIAGGIAYRLIVDYQRVRDFLALMITSAIGTTVGVLAYGYLANTLAGYSVVMSHLLIMSAIVASAFSLLYAIVHVNTAPTPGSSVMTGVGFIGLALMISTKSGLFVGWSVASVVALIVAPFFLGGGAYLGSFLRRR